MLLGGRLHDKRYVRILLLTGLRRGAAGLGLQTTKYLAQRNCTVYVASRNHDKSLRGIAEAKASFPDSHGSTTIRFHQFDLSSIQEARQSAEAFLKLQDRLDILVANGGVSMLAQNELSQDGYERMFATNHLGHFAFVTTLLGRAWFRRNSAHLR